MHVGGYAGDAGVLPTSLLLGGEVRQIWWSGVHRDDADPDCVLCSNDRRHEQSVLPTGSVS